MWKTHIHKHHILMYSATIYASYLGLTPNPAPPAVFTFSVGTASWSHGVYILMYAK